jgi:prepilin-type N-terminal cleavage/methylation domain-containing protein
MTPKSRPRPRGFTLPEVLVTVALIAVLAGAVVPTVVGQLQKGDSNRLGSDLLAIRGGVEQFAADVRKYPANIGQITGVISTSLTPFQSATAYTGADVIHWKGPYLTKDSIAARITAYGDSIVGVFNVDTLAPSGVNSTATGQRYMVVVVPGLDSSMAVALDNMFDDGNILTGSIRWRKHVGSERDTLKFLMMPVQ